MAGSIAIVSATFPPDRCGVADYTRYLARELARSRDVTVLTAHRMNPRPPAGVPVTQAFNGQSTSDIFAIRPHLERLKPDAVVFQYDPYSYGATHAFNPYLPLAIHRVRRWLPRARIGVVVHETFVSPSTLRRAAMTSWQRAQLYAVGRAADLLVTVVEAWAIRLSSWFPRARVVYLPVGNNIPRVEADRTSVRDRLGLSPRDLVLGWLGRTRESDFDWLRAALRGARAAGASPFVLHIGVGPDEASRALSGIDAKVAGLMPADELSRHLSAIDVYLAPMSEGVTTRRTSVIAALAHGLPVVAAAGPMTDSIFRRENGRSLLLVDRGRGEGFEGAVRELASSPGRRSELGQAAEELADRFFSWEAISKGFLNALNGAR